MNDSTTKQCQVDGCSQKHRARGYCALHYKRAHYRGEFSTTQCTVPGCTRTTYLRGYCGPHFHQARSHGGKIPTPLTLADKFWQGANKGKPHDCWIWNAGQPQANPYGRIWHDGKAHGAHQVSYYLQHGTWPQAHQLIRHTCDTPRCVNPAHLVIGTPADNSRDMTNRQRQAYGAKHGNAILVDDDIREMRRLYATGEYRQVDLAGIFGTDQTNVSLIVRRKAWAHVD